jgi:deoxycytidine triphosphate deaminase
MAASPATPGLPSFPATDEEAQQRFDEFRSKDPFPEVPSALLNSADLLDYIATVGMLSPYEITPQQRDRWLKPASCAVACTGDVLRFGFDTVTQQVTKTEEYTLKERQRLNLPANTITFLQLGTTFRVPNYIAARFNLAIREIHRGFLVGTGPLVDPGFVGRLFIPLHNLTSNDYTVKFGEPLVWVEFTKLSPNKAWASAKSLPRTADFAPFPERKLKRKTPADYLDHANDGKPIASSIPQEVDRAVVVADEARTRVLSLRTTLRNLGIGATVIGALAVVLPMINLVSDTNNRIDDLAADRPELTKQLTDLRTEAMDARRQISRVTARLKTQEREIRRLRANGGG